ncbi:hypothetical protein Pfo_012224 [Paulownia fortunei]|nr:hypothetical protein Pfo_012224 [Paulownia fortunei]
MAAYAALVSLMHIMEQIQHRSPISLDKKQIESLHKRVSFLQEFLEDYSHGASKEEEGLMSRIADAAYAAEDITESHIVDQILGGSPSAGEKSSLEIYRGLQKVIEDMDFIKKEVMEIKDKRGTHDQQHRNSMPAACSLRSSSTGMNSMVGFDDVLIQLMDKLTGQQSTREIIPIVGMGGIGKTTLARNVYENQLIVDYFDIRAWVTIYQEYNVREILLEVLLCQKRQESSENLASFTKSMSRMSETQLGETLYKSLLGRRYLIIMDDLWSIEAWDRVKFFFPDSDCNNDSRIVITTRLSKLAFHFGSCGLEVNFLDEDKSWKLLCKKVFGEESCPPNLEEIGKKIAENCRGLPLSIVVIGGHLAKSKRTLEYWKYVAENLNSLVKLEDNEHCLKILSLSYEHLPVHLKPCFLYMGFLSENHDIRISRLIKLWVAEGFLKPDKAKCLEEVAEEYLKDLIDRNLILIRKWGCGRKMKHCNIHDLLRELCLKEAEKEKFFLTSVHSLDIPQGINIERRIFIHQRASEMGYRSQVLHSLQSSSLCRSLTCNFGRISPPLPCRLLRVLNVVDKFSLEVIFKLVNLRYLAFDLDWNSKISLFPSSIYLLRNLQTLIVVGIMEEIVAPSEIWELSQLRHLKFHGVVLLEPPSGRMEGQDDLLVLENLQTLLTIKSFKCTKEVIKRIPNIKKLRLIYDDLSMECDQGSRYCLNNLGCLHKLESLGCFFLKNHRPNQSDLLRGLAFLHSLKKLTLCGSYLHWDDMTKIGLLPHLEVLKLLFQAITGPNWNPVEGEFLRLKFLLIQCCDDLVHWTADSIHFPCLEQLVLQHMYSLEEIPSGIGDIATLRLIQLDYCSNSLVDSALAILEEQQSLGNEDLQVQSEHSRLVCLTIYINWNFELTFDIKYSFGTTMKSRLKFTSLILNRGNWIKTLLKNKVSYLMLDSKSIVKSLFEFDSLT